MPRINENIVSSTGDSHMMVADWVKPNGEPAVMLLVRKDADGIYDATLDGHPALAVVLSEDPSGKSNAPWEVGHLLAEAWERAKKAAKKS